MSAFSSFFAFFARIFLAVMFVVSGWAKLTDFGGTVGYVASNGLPVPQLFAALTILVELGGGILLILGLFSRLAAFIMAGFTLLTIVIVHHFWTMADAEMQLNQLMAMKNLAIAGGLLMVTAFGPGAWAIGPGRD
ncbi:DoxX family protein [Mycobacterium sp. KBS0706]|uniref:DoxX family protein n=1 Tax=Mycobacterium sp. KBS0706 TaxID=2578109 RepID=UPI00110FAC99|nr:DoxX family protein [Mycobacterium sp. KBS0706]TSD90748.1 DoxX family protein [Mycobacterium sp. KBS0706]